MDDDPKPSSSKGSYQQLIDKKASPAENAAVKKEFQDIVSKPESLENAANYLYESLLDDAVMGEFLDVHYLYKTGALEKKEKPQTSKSAKASESLDIFGNPISNKPVKDTCQCPVCAKPVGVSRFCCHLDRCMGISRNRTCSPRKRSATKKRAQVSECESE